MNLEQHTTPETIRRIFKTYEARRKSEHRPHLGGSQIGRECERALWYQFRWAWTPKFEGRMLRLFETGDREEDRIVRNLRDIGVTVWDRDPETGRQVAFHAFGGHFALSLDGVGEGFPESSVPHTLEFKTMNTKNFKALQNMGLKKAQPVYWAQCQIGMHLSKLDRCYFFSVCKETDAIYGERVKYDPAEGMMLQSKAGRIIFSEQPPARISEEKSDWRCKFCTYWAVCHGCKIPEVNCRTCAHVTPEQDGTWSCGKGKDMTKACEWHLYNPYAMPAGWEVRNASENHVEYCDPDGEVIYNERNSQQLFDARMVE